jgi:hypothetical protein
MDQPGLDGSARAPREPCSNRPRQTSSVFSMAAACLQPGASLLPAPSLHQHAVVDALLESVTVLLRQPRYELRRLLLPKRNGRNAPFGHRQGCRL